tara:strand:- start:1340 stop:1873 length:534 start_codon:yes stop_codon:yes gene_type:complete
MKEIEARKAILKRTDLTDSDKVILMAILLTVDWQTWTNRTSYTALAKLTGKKRHNLVKYIKKFEKLELISRDWFTSGKCKAPVMKLNIENLEQSDSQYITPCDTKDNISSYTEDNTTVIQETTEAVIQDTTLTTNYNNNIYTTIKQYVYEVEPGEVWGNELREQVEADLQANKVGES